MPNSAHPLPPALLCCVIIMAIPVVEFSMEGYKIRKIFGMKLLNFENLSSGELSKIGHHFRK